MSLVQFNKVYKQFAGDFILKDISFSIEEKDKIGLVGLNGVGKSTIIRMLLGKERVDGAENNPNEIGEIIKSPSMRIGYLSQNHEFSDERNTIYEEMMSVFSEEREIWNKLQKVNMLLGTAEGEELENLINQSAELSSLYEAKNGYEIEYKIKQILTGLELTDEYYNLYLKDLSGGERTRVSLAKLLLIEPDLLILDEPTNHLDLISIEWLEDYLKRYNKAFLLVSHDRIFLDNVCNKIYEIENRKLYKYDGNFSSFILQKEMILKGEIKRYEKEQEKIRKMEEYIDRFRAGIKARQAKGRQKILDRIERMDDPVFNPQRMKLKFETDGISGDNVLKVEGIEKTFGDKKVLNNISFKLYKGERVGIIGKNGIGKSTLLKIIAGQIVANSGEVDTSLDFQTEISMMPQADILIDDLTVFEIVSLKCKMNKLSDACIDELLMMVELQEHQKQYVGSLSGGQKRRLSLLLTILNSPKLIFLDEPTTGMDLESVDNFWKLLENKNYTSVIVTHDFNQIDHFFTKVLILKDGIITANESVESIHDSGRTIEQYYREKIEMEG